MTAHPAATFARFADQLAKSRGGDFRPPFTPGELAALARMHERIGGLPPGDDLWDRILRRTGRNGEV